jgi:hypothetical protein
MFPLLDMMLASVHGFGVTFSLVTLLAAHKFTTPIACLLPLSQGVFGWLSSSLSLSRLQHEEAIKRFSYCTTTPGTQAKSYLFEWQKTK